MIKSFRDKATRALFENGDAVPEWGQFARVARRKLLMVDAAKQLEDLRSPPGNRLEALKHDRKGQHSIRINDKFRVCFIWSNDGAVEVEIVDYH